MEIDIGQTQVESRDSPVYNRRFQFEVASDDDIIRVTVMDPNIRGLFIQTELVMQDLKDYMNDPSIEIKELWFRLDD